jgi:XXXCH domain-containing protein
MNFRSLKQSLSEVFDRIKAAVADGDLPNKHDVEQFVRLSRLFHAQAQDDWAGEVEDFCLLADQLNQAARRKHLEEVIMLVDSLNDAQNYCHRSFRSRP